MLRGSRLHRKPPSGHLSQTADPCADPKCTFAAKLNSDQSERLVTRRDERKLGPAEDVRRQLSELWFRIHSTWVFLHDDLQFQRSELAIEINHRADADELHIRMLFEDGGKDVCNEVDAFLNRPSSHKHKQVGVWIDSEIGPLLCLPPQVSACGFEGGIDGDDLLCLYCFIPGFDIARIWVREFSDML